MVIVGYTIDKMKKRAIREMKKMVDELNEKQIPVYFITNATYEDFEEFRHTHQLAVDYYFADGVKLKTMIRSSPGMLLLKDCVVVGKWHWRDTPKYEQLRRGFDLQ